LEAEAAAATVGTVRRLTLPACLLAAASGASAQPAPGEGFQVERYEVELRPDLATTAISGSESIAIQSTSSGLAFLSFTANALRITGATADGSPVRVESSTDAIVFTLPKPLEKGGKAKLRFHIDGRPARGVTAAAGSLYTGYFACDWMVCLQDSPGDKAHLALDLLLPAGIRSASVGRPAPARGTPGGLVRHRWRSTRPYSPYLYAFAAGPFERRSSATARGELVYLDGTGGKADLGALFAETPAIAAFLAGKAGMDLPDRRYVQLLVPGGEAQETAGFSLIGRSELDKEREDPSSAWIVAHEMAHLWWGNLVTCAGWRDFWLNEGIATFMVAAWQEHRLGEGAYRQALDAARRRVARARELGFDKPLAWPGKYPSLGVRRAVQYSKGALFLAELRQTIGDEAFWNGLRRFTRKHAGGTVTSRDFQQAMEKSSGRDLAPMFAQWVYGE
jgi:aminopeptidase N